jgi:hypothetical protein
MLRLGLPGLLSALLSSDISHQLPVKLCEHSLANSFVECGVELVAYVVGVAVGRAHGVLVEKVPGFAR